MQQLPDFIFSLIPGDKVWDIETFPNFFSAVFMDAETDREWYFEISTRRDDLRDLCRFIDCCRGLRWVGFNTLGFDYPVLHFIYKHAAAHLTVADIYRKSQEIINTDWNNRFAHIIWERDQLVEQVDLFKVHHFDNNSKSTSLKVLEFNMRADSVEETPIPFGTWLTEEQMDEVAGYNRNDVKETRHFLHLSRPAIQLRESLSAKYGESMMNCSDVKIGEKILVQALEDRGIQCFTVEGGRRKKLQTVRDRIALRDVILPYVQLERPEFRAIAERLADTVLSAREVSGFSTEGAGKIETKGVFKDLVAVVDGLEYVFGTGGIHASIESQIVESSATHQIVDVDVASYYPNLGIQNRLFPAHLGVEFCDAYEGVYQTRKTFKKGTPENEAYKLALNGAYGGSNNEFSPLRDPQYTMAITINGQLSLAMLVEQLIKTPGLRMIQANTDGVTYLCPREYLDHTRAVCRWWMEVTKLVLEEALYKRMFIRDVNSYIAEKEDGKLKRIGAYAYETAMENPGTRELPWHKDWSFRVVAKAAEAALVRGENLRDFVTRHADVYDFFGRTKIPRGSELQLGGQKVPSVIRYFISTDGQPLEKVMPGTGEPGQFKKANGVPDEFYRQVMAEIGPNVWDARIHTKNRSVYESERRMALHAGWRVTMVNHWSEGEFTLCIEDQINYEFYIKEAEKLVTLLKG